VLDMVELTRLNNKKIYINSDLIEFIEQTPDTVITLISGNKIVVAESIEEVVEKVVQYKRRIFTNRKKVVNH
jgi:flagellar protein FlbD